MESGCAKQEYSKQHVRVTRLRDRDAARTAVARNMDNRTIYYCAFTTAEHLVIFTMNYMSITFRYVMLPFILKEAIAVKVQNVLY